MSFYGNIKRVQSSPYVFDKYYPNRAAMEDAVLTDNVYIGRYVLIKYNIKDDWKEEDFPSGSGVSIEDTPTYFDKFTIAENPSNAGTQMKKVYIGYELNALKDINKYNDTFDATVWQKIYTNTADGDQLEKYIMVAELNASVPRMELDVISPKYTDGQRIQGELNEEWNEPQVLPSISSEDAYVFQMPNVLHLDVGKMNENFYAKQLINPGKRWRMTTDLDENGIGKSTNPNANQGGGGLKENAISHEDMLSDAYNYMKWKNFRINPATGQMEEVNSAGPIDGKKLETKLYAFGQLISDLYDALYGVPTKEDGPRPFYTDQLSEVLSNYDKGLVGILSSIATDMKGDGSKDYYGRTLLPGMYYYFTSSWNSADENPDNFIENIPEVIGSDSELGQNKSHYRINYWDNTSGSYITNVVSGQN